MPKIIPVINLLVLFDKTLNRSCIPPSKTSGTRSSKHTKYCIKQPKINNKKEHKYPIKIPVQREHKGS